jgi:acetyl-CoA synthetase
MSDQPSVIPKNDTPPVAPNMADYDAARADFSWQQAAKDEVDYFDDGTLNIAYNCVDRHAAGVRKDKAALMYDSGSGVTESYSFGQLKELTDKFANVLAANGVAKGDRVFIFLPSIPERYVAFLGILKLGAIAGTMFAAFQEMALLDRLADSEASVVITNADLYPRIKNIQKDLPNLKKIIIVERGSDAQPEAADVVLYNQEMAKASSDFEVVHMQPDDYSYMLYTSGTTGKPKGVVHAHNDILQAIVTTKYVLDIQEKDVYWCTSWAALR